MINLCLSTVSWNLFLTRILYSRRREKIASAVSCLFLSWTLKGGGMVAWINWKPLLISNEGRAVVALVQYIGGPCLITVTRVCGWLHIYTVYLVFIFLSQLSSSVEEVVSNYPSCCEKCGIICSVLVGVIEIGSIRFYSTPCHF